jgi:hypothetical protein
MQVRAETTINEALRRTATHPTRPNSTSHRSPLRIVNPACLAVLALLVRRQSHGCDESGHYRYAEAEVAMYRMSELKLVERQHQR